jgi:fatty acid desaturase
LRIKWQTDSFKHAFSSKNYLESILLTIHWIWVFVVFPWKVWLLGSLVGGTILAWVVTSNHQAETKLEGKTYGNNKSDSKYKIHDLAVHQITTTRNIYCDNWLTNLLCGGLQYQIEHHLFPRMPIYNLPVVRGMIIDYCKTHNLEYLQENCLDIMKRNFDNLKKHAEAKLY